MPMTIHSSRAGAPNISGRTSAREARSASMQGLSATQLQFIMSLGDRLTPKQRQIVTERAEYEAKLKTGGELTGRHGWVALSSTTEAEAARRGATTNRQVLDFAYYGEFLPADLETAWSRVFPRAATRSDRQDRSAASLSALSSAQLRFVYGLGERLNPVQRRIVNDRAQGEAAYKVGGELSGRGGWVQLSTAKETEARQRGATTMRQVLDYAYYGDFLPAHIEADWRRMFPL